MKRSHKFRAKPTELDGIRFASKAEAARYAQLQLLARCGQILNLRHQVRFELAPSVRLAGETRAKPALCYWADFVYYDKATGREVIEDVKGAITEGYRIKRHLLKAVHGLDITEIKAR